MKWLTRTSLSPIGIDIGTRYVKAVQIQHRGNTRTITTAAALPRTQPGIPFNDEEAARLADFLDQQSFVGKHAVVAVPNNLLTQGILELPPRSSGAPIDQIAQVEHARLHKYKPGTFELACWDLPDATQTTQTTHVMTTACEHNHADQLIDAFAHAKLDVIALDTTAWALTRATRKLLSNTDDLVGILDLGWSAARLFLLHRGIIIYERNIPSAGLNALHASFGNTDTDPRVIDQIIIEKLTTNNDQSSNDRRNKHPQALNAITSYLDFIIEEIHQSFSYATHRYRNTTSESLAITGGGATIPYVEQFMVENLKSPVRNARLSKLELCLPHLNALANTTVFTAALGLAIYTENMSS